MEDQQMQAQPPAPGADERPDGQREHYCPSCGGGNPGSANFCKWCGQAIDYTREIPKQEASPAVPSAPDSQYQAQWQQGPSGKGPLPGPSGFTPTSPGGCLKTIG